MPDQHQASDKCACGSERRYCGDNFAAPDQHQAGEERWLIEPREPSAEGTTELVVRSGPWTEGAWVVSAHLAHSERERANKLERELEMRDEQMLLSGEAGVEWPRYQAERERAARAEHKLDHEIKAREDIAASQQDTLARENAARAVIAGLLTMVVADHGEDGGDVIGLAGLIIAAKVALNPNQGGTDG